MLMDAARLSACEDYQKMLVLLLTIKTRQVTVRVFYCKATIV